MPRTPSRHTDLPAQLRLAVANTTQTHPGQVEPEKLAERTGLPLAAPDDPAYDAWLTQTPTRLELRFASAIGFRPLYTEFARGPQAYRQKHPARELLLRAIGLRHGVRNVIDATAGLGRDAFVLAAAGSTVHACERNPVLFTLLQDGLNRARTTPDAEPWLDERLTLHQCDARRWLEALPDTHRPDVVYLDPMYPPQTKSAAAQREMRILRALISDVDDTPALLEAALQAATRHVVIKRPRLFETQFGKPHRTYAGRSTRFDVYVVQRA